MGSYWSSGWRRSRRPSRRSPWACPGPAPCRPDTTPPFATWAAPTASRAPPTAAPRSGGSAGSLAGSRRAAFLEGTRSKLSDLGANISAERFLAYKGMGLAIGAVLGLWTMASSFGLGMLVLLLMAPIGFFYPDVWLRRRQETRAAETRRALPDSLDLMAISVEAGVGLEGALARAAEDLGGALGEEYSRLLREMQLGASRREAFLEMRRRVNVPEMSSFVLALLQADSLGIAVGKVLRNSGERAADEAPSAGPRAGREDPGEDPGPPDLRDLPGAC